MGFVFKVYLSRTVGAEVIGLYQIALSIFGMLTCITASGIPLTLARKTAEYSSSGKEDIIPSLISSSIITGVSASILIVIIITAIQGSISFLFKDIRALPLFLIMLPALISTTLYNVFRAWFWGKKDYTTFSVAELVEEVFRILFTILLAGGIISSLKGSYGIALAFTVADVACAVFILIMFIRKGGKLKPPKEVIPLIKSSAPVTAMRFFTGIVGSFTAIVIPAQLALYGMTVNEATAAFGRVVGLAFPLIYIPLALTGSIMIVMIPEISSQNALGNTEGLSVKIDKVITMSIAITGLFLAGFIAFGREIGIIIYDDIVAGEFIKAGAWMMIFLVINQTTSSILNSLALEINAFINYAIGTAVLIVLIFRLPEYIGIYALIVASIASSFITLLLNCITLYRKGVLKLNFIKNTAIILIFSIPAAYISRSVFELFAYSMPLILSTTIALILLIVIYLLMILVSNVIDINYFYVKKLNKRKLYIK